MSPKFYITKRNNGIFYYGFRDSQGKISWHTTKCTRRSEAINFLKQFKQSTANRATPTLTEFTQTFSNRMQGIIRPTTLEGYFLHVRQFTDVVGDKALSDYTLNDVDKFRDIRLKIVKPITLNIELRALKSIFNKAEKWDIIPHSIFRKVQQLRVAKNFPLFMTRDEFRKLYSGTTDQTRKDLYLWSVLTGCRISESINVKWSDIDLGRKCVTIRNSEDFTTKTGNERIVPISDTLMPIVTKRMSNNHSSEYVFHRRGYKLDRTSLTHRFKEDIRRLKLNPLLKFHSMRHTFASWGVQDGVSIFSISKLLGHSSVVTTEIYM
jgi:integrase